MNNDIKLIKADFNDSEKLLDIQKMAFMTAQQKYGHSPAEHSIDNIKSKILSGDYYKIVYFDNLIGGVYVHSKYDSSTFNLHVIYILPVFQGKGIAQQVIKQIENMYPDVKRWTLDTPITECGNCYLYEKLDYKRTGRIEKINEKLTLIYFEKQMT